MSETIRAVCYYRMSSTDQDGSIEQQQTWAKGACPPAHIEIVSEFTDAAKKGHETAKRTEFHKMLDFCRDAYRRHQPVEVIVCWHSNRFSRSDAIETSWFVQEFRNVGVKRMFTSNGWVDFSKMEDRILFGITQDASNHAFSRDLGKTTLRGRITTAAAGYWCGGPIPVGYLAEAVACINLDGKRRPRRRLVLDPATAPLVQRIFKKYATDQTSLYRLAQELNGEGIPTPRALKGHGRAAKLWDPTSIMAILKNELYLGDLLWNRKSRGKFFGVVDVKGSLDIVKRDSQKRKKNEAKEQIRGAVGHEPLIDRATFDKVQRLLVANRKNTTPKACGGDFLLTSLMRCAHCGKPMIGSHRQVPRVGQVKKYVCAVYGLHGKQLCNFNSIDEAPLFKCLAAKLQAKLLNPKTLDQLREACRRNATAEDVSAGEEKDLQKRLAELERQVATAAKKYLLVEDERLSKDCRLAVESLGRERDRVERDLEVIREKKSNRPDPEALIDAAVELMHEFETVIHEEQPAEQRAVLRSLIDHIDLFFDHREVGKRTYCTFARGVIYVKDGILPSTYFLNTPSNTPQTAAGALPRPTGS